MQKNIAPKYMYMSAKFSYKGSKAIAFARMQTNIGPLYNSILA